MYCSNATICGYVAYVTLAPGEHQVFHRDVSAHIGVSVYGFDRTNSYGYPGRSIPLQCKYTSYFWCTCTGYGSCDFQYYFTPLKR